MQTRVHINVYAADLERSIAFYTRLWGVGPDKVRGDYANWRLDTPALHLALVSDPEHTHTRGGEHFGVELFEDTDLFGWRERAETAGLKVRREEQVTCCYAVANKFWASDPDGNEWEFWVRSDEAESMHDKAMPRETAEGSVCCAPAPAAPQGAAPC